MMERSDVGRNVFATIIICNKTFVACDGKMNHLQGGVPQKRQRFNHCLINSARALAASHYKHRGEVLAEPKFLTRHASIQTNQLGTHWSARHFSVGFWKKRSAFLEAEHDCAHHPRRQTVRFSRDSV